MLCAEKNCTHVLQNAKATKLRNQGGINVHHWELVESTCISSTFPLDELCFPTGEIHFPDGETKFPGPPEKLGKIRENCRN